LVEKATPVEMLNSIRGKVHSLKIKEDLLYKVQSKFKVSNIIRDHEHIMVRVVGDENPLIDGVEVIDESPNLEDLFLYYFDSDRSL
ncbi:MAG: ABC transporter ATP-binding protein, partial [Paeniclostridium sordellii]|nr:ABC transporter ATP-binding protein [Paeniclostridium sordellii]